MANDPPRLERAGVLAAAPNFAVLGLLAAPVILAGALAPQNPIPAFFHGQDKLEHALAFAALAFAAQFRAAPSKLRFLILAGFAFGLEAAQALLTATRTPALDDALTSLVGVGVGLGVARLASHVRQFAIPPKEPHPVLA
jgi:hypothetical protein